MAVVGVPLIVWKVFTLSNSDWCSTVLLISFYESNRDCSHLTMLHFILFCLKDKPWKSKVLLMWCCGGFLLWLKSFACFSSSCLYNVWDFGNFVFFFLSDQPVSMGFGIVAGFFTWVKLLPGSQCLICSPPLLFVQPLTHEDVDSQHRLLGRMDAKWYNEETHLVPF